MVQLWGLDAKGRQLHVRRSDLRRRRGATRTAFPRVAEYAQNGMSLVDDGEVERVRATAVSSQFFECCR